MSGVELAFAIALVAKLSMELALEALNRSWVLARREDAPSALVGTMSAESYRRSVDYTVAKSRFTVWELLIDAGILATVILSGALPMAHAWWIERLGFAPWSEALFFLAVLGALGLPGLPLDYWRQFKLEESFGFNRSSKGLWIMDKLKGLALGLALGFPLLWLLLSLVGWLGTYWWVYGFVFFFVFQLIMMVLYPLAILPLFNRLSPLEDGGLKERLLALAQRAGFACESIHVIDGSKRSGHANAFFTGFGRFRRIVLYDTLIEQMNPAEIEAVLAHEIGHYKLGHIPKMLALSAAITLLAFWGIDRLAFSEWFLGGFGFVGDSVGVSFLLFALVFGLVSFWLGPLMSLLSRKHEYEADAFARDAVGDWRPLSAALRRLSEKNLSNLNPHPAYSGFHYSHPTLVERERALKAGFAGPQDDPA